MYNTNMALKSFCQQTRANRRQMPIEQRVKTRVEHVGNGVFCNLWFLTTGCLHDAKGGCVMCNYGSNNAPFCETDEDALLSEIELNLNTLPKRIDDLLFSPSGSILDLHEVSESFRKKLLTLSGRLRADRVLFETRADTIDENGLEFLRELSPESDRFIEIGLESSNDWILKHCLNKGATFESFCRAVDLAHRNGFRIIANVGLGYPFMSERASIKYSVQAVFDALNAGADSVVLFPYHIKHATLLSALHELKLYHCVSLWSLVDALIKSKVDSRRIQISWYKDYYGKDFSDIIVSPTTCQYCKKTMMDSLDEFRNHPSEQLLNQIMDSTCNCKDSWQNRLNNQQPDIDVDYVEKVYRSLAEAFPLSNDLLEKEIATMRREFVEMF